MIRSVRAARFAVSLLLAVALTVTVAVAPAEARQDLDAEQYFISLINRDRQAAGLDTVAPAADVRDVALAWSNQMASERRMYHNPSYSTQYCCWQRAAENVGWTTISNMDDSAKVTAAVERLHQAFMDSDGHRRNIMHPDHDHIGLAIEMREDSCPDTVGMPDCMWVTENFRDWDGTQPSGGLVNPYTGSTSRDSTADSDSDPVVSDTVVPGGFDGNLDTVRRLGRTADSAIQASMARFESDGATHAVISRDDAFPDSLAGAPLTHDGPLLLTPTDGLSTAVANELARVLPRGATVYLLGGEHALARNVDTAIRDLGLKPTRLAGDDRIETALAVATEVRRLYGDTHTVVIARAFAKAGDPNGTSGWVDSVTGGAWAANRRAPVLITPTDHLPDNVRTWLTKDDPSVSVVLGGPSAVSDTALAAVPNGTRVAGPDRTGTAAAVATELWGITPRSSDRQFVVIDGWAPNGWRHGLAMAGLAADAGAPMLLANSLSPDQPAPTTTMLTSCNTPSVDLVVAGAISDTLARTLESVDGAPC